MPGGRAIYSQRLGIVEPVFGHIAGHKRMDRSTLHGKAKINIQWKLYCMVHNLEKIARYPNVEPSAKARQQLHAAVRRQLNRYTTHQRTVATVRKVNQTVRGWSQYFHHGNSTRVSGREQDWLRQRLRTWLWRKYDRTRSRWTFFTQDRLHGQYGLFSLPTRAAYLR